MSRKEIFKRWLRSRVESQAPLSSYPMALENFIPINKTKNNCAILSQVKLFSSKRIKSKLGKISEEDFIKLKNKLKGLINL